MFVGVELGLFFIWNPRIAKVEPQHVLNRILYWFQFIARNSKCCYKYGGGEVVFVYDDLLRAAAAQEFIHSFIVSIVFFFLVSSFFFCLFVCLFVYAVSLCRANSCCSRRRCCRKFSKASSFRRNSTNRKRHPAIIIQTHPQRIEIILKDAS